MYNYTYVCSISKFLAEKQNVEIDFLLRNYI